MDAQIGQRHIPAAGSGFGVDVRHQRQPFGHRPRIRGTGVDTQQAARAVGVRHQFRRPDALGRQMAAEIHADAGQGLLGKAHGVETRLHFLAVQHRGTGQLLHGIHGKTRRLQPLVGGLGVIGAEHQRFQPERRIGDFTAHRRRPRRPAQQFDIRAFQHDQPIARPQVMYRLVAQVKALTLEVRRQRIQPVAHHDDGMVEFACRGTACTSCRCRTGTGRCGRPSATRCVPAVRHRPIPTGPGLRRSPSDGIARSAHAAGRLRLRPARPVPTTARAPSSARGRRRRGCGPACPRTVRRLRACIPAWGSSAHSRADGCPDAGNPAPTGVRASACRSLAA
ncbi:hypothetical protein G6F22_014014 [Rhizopus arrhizus]|nr:hypothetical protein G6F22_014014 [Rhizopus arrhizus]